MRTVSDVKGRWENLKKQIKRKYREGRFPATGGGPDESRLTRVEQLLLSHFEGSPDFSGIVGGIDTFPVEAIMNQPCQQPAVTVVNEKGEEIGKVPLAVETIEHVKVASMPMGGSVPHPEVAGDLPRKSMTVNVAVPDMTPARPAAKRRLEESATLQEKKLKLEIKKLELEISLLEKSCNV